MDDDKGTTRVLIHSEKGRDTFKEIAKELKVFYVDPGELTYGVKEMLCSVSTNENRTGFFNDANSKTGAELFEKWFPENFKVKSNRMLRKILLSTGLYSLAKKVYGLRGK